MSESEPGTSEQSCFEIARKRVDRTCRGRLIARLLKLSFSCSQEGWRQSTGHRFVIYLNQYLETPALIMAAMWQNDWTTSIDLKNAYFHVPVAKRSQKYLRFVINGMSYQFWVLPFSLQSFNSPSGFHACNERDGGICTPKRCSAAHIPGRLATLVAGSSASTAGHDVHAGPLCLPRPDRKHLKVEPDPKSGVHILGNLLSVGSLHLSPIDGQMKVTIDALASLQACNLSLGNAVDETRRHTNVDGLAGALGKTASETDTAQFS